MADFITKIDEWMEGTVWLTRCSNYFRAANGRVVTQWPRSARAFWEMTRWFRPADYTFDPPADLADGRGGIIGGDSAASRWTPTSMFEDRLDPALRHFAAARTDLSSNVLGVVRDSLNQRRAETSPRCRPDRRRDREPRGGSPIPVRIYRGRSGARAGGDLLPLRGFRARQSRHRSPPVRGVGATRPLHGRSPSITDSRRNIPYPAALDDA